MDVGLKQAGFKTNLAIDFNKDCCDTFKKNHEECEVIHGEVKDYEESLSNFDIIIGGPPCQDFSRARINRRGFNPAEVDRFWKIVDRIKPEYYMMENVKDVIKICDRDNVLINCVDYGTPQLRRRRLFSNIKIPEPTHKQYVSVKDALGIDGFVEDRKSTFGEKYNKDGGKFRRRETTRPCFTIITDYRVWFISPSGIVKKATDKEVSILQGFPKDYEFIGNGASIKTQIGNALPSQPIKEIFASIK